MAWIFECTYISSLLRSLSLCAIRTTYSHAHKNIRTGNKCVLLTLVCCWLSLLLLLDLLLFLVCASAQDLLLSSTHSIFILRIPPATKAINQVSFYIYCFTVLYGVLFFLLSSLASSHSILHIDPFSCRFSYLFLKWQSKIQNSIRIVSVFLLLLTVTIVYPKT